MLVFTTIPPQVLSTLQVQNIYKARWQIELYIKRLKSLLNIDLLRAKKDGKLAEGLFTRKATLRSFSRENL